MSEMISNDNGLERSRQLRQEFLDSISEERKEFLINRSEQLSQHVEAIWKSFGHKSEWINDAHIDTNRNVNRPDDESFYVRRDARCEGCEVDMWILIDEVETTIHGGQHKCEK